MNNPPLAIPYLKKGDKIAITCPAKKLPKPMDDAVALLERWGLEIVIGETVNASYHQFAGDDELRARDLQRFIDDDSIKAIIAARGGYGTVRIIDKVDFSRFETNPKWLIGFSDITVLHAHLFANYNTQTIHGQMPVNIPDASAHSLQTLKKALFGEELNYYFNSHAQNRSGNATGILTGTTHHRFRHWPAIRLEDPTDSTFRGFDRVAGAPAFVILQEWRWTPESLFPGRSVPTFAR